MLYSPIFHALTRVGTHFKVRLCIGRQEEQRGIYPIAAKRVDPFIAIKGGTIAVLINGGLFCRLLREGVSVVSVEAPLHMTERLGRLKQMGRE